MKNLPTHDTATSIIVDLTNVDAAFQDPKFKALLANGYKIATVIPASDEGRPIAIFIFEPYDAPVFALESETWVKAAVYILAALLVAVLALLYTVLLIP